MWKRFRKMLATRALYNTDFGRLGFQSGTPELQSHLGRQMRAFMLGYETALIYDEFGADVARSFLPWMEVVEEPRRGAAHEGAAMGLTTLDYFMPWSNGTRFVDYLNGEGSQHGFVLFLGAGMALHQLSRPINRLKSKVDPVFGWLLVDGYGYNACYSKWSQRIAVPDELDDYARKAFDQGVGRGLWFVDGGDVARIPQTISGYGTARKGDLWSGVGVACAYAGYADEDGYRRLTEAAGEHRAQLALGIACAARMRTTAHNPAAHTELACRVVWNQTTAELTDLTEEALQDLPRDGAIPAYEVWRERIRHRYSNAADSRQ